RRARGSDWAGRDARPTVLRASLWAGRDAGLAGGMGGDGLDGRGCRRASHRGRRPDTIRGKFFSGPFASRQVLRCRAVARTRPALDPSRRHVMALTRREFVGGLIAAGAAAATGRARPIDERPGADPASGPPDGQTAGPDGTASPAGPADFTFVHLTDMHVTPKRWGDRGYRACIESVLALRPRPAFALLGGDLAFDALYPDTAASAEQIRQYREITAGLGM